jgi:hypothetical protein
MDAKLMTQLMNQAKDLAITNYHDAKLMTQLTNDLAIS